MNQTCSCVNVKEWTTFISSGKQRLNSCFCGISHKRILLSFFVAATFLWSQSFSTLQASSIIINLKAPKEIKGAYYCVCISSYNIRKTFSSQFDELYKSKDGKFNIELDPGRYMIAMLYRNAQPLFYHFYVPEKTSTVEFNVTLDRLCIPEKIDSVELYGDYNDWAFDKRIKLKYNDSKKNWYLPKAEIPDNLKCFKLLLPGSSYLQDLPIDSITTWVWPANLYSKPKKDIVFNPADYKRGNPKPLITGTVDTAYNTLMNKIQTIVNTLDMPFGAKSMEDVEKYATTYKKHLNDLNLVIENTPERLKWATFNAMAEMLRISNYGQMYYASNTKNNKMLNANYQSESYENQIKNIAKIFKDIEFTNLTICEADIDELWNIDYYLDNLNLYEELHIPYGYFKQKLVDSQKKLDNQNLAGEISWCKATNFRYNNPEKAIKAYQTILEQYPRYRNCKNGTIQKTLFGLRVKEGAMAPDFNVTTVSGKTISLSSLRGKYVFIDFWGTWCSPCRGEIPNVKKLAESYPSEKLVVLGIAHDKADDLKNFMAQNDIKYENAVDSPEIMDKYGINSWPTTFLIGPDGTIVAKNLRGELIELVKGYLK